MIDTTRILGYTDRISAAPGETIAFKVSCDGAVKYRAEIVRIVCADPDPDGPGLRYDRVPGGDLGFRLGRCQGINPGSYVRIARPPPLPNGSGIGVAALIWPTLPGKSCQTLLGQWSETRSRGYALQIDQSGALAFVVGDGRGSPHRLSTEVSLPARAWAFAAASFDPQSGRIQLWQEVLGTKDRYAVQTVIEVSEDWRGAAPFLIGAHSGDGLKACAGYYNGKIEAPRLAARALRSDVLWALVEADAEAAARDAAVVGSWDLARDIQSTRVHDASGNRLDGETVNLPSRAVTGHRWDGNVLDWRLAPEQYAAIHFHEDDIYDCGWETDFIWHIGTNVRSGFYAARLTGDGVESWICFFVRPPRDRCMAPVAVVAPTATYMAYANTHVKFDSLNTEVLFESVLTLSQEEMYLNKNRELGYSLYDTHVDGSGVKYSSRLRPILTLRPGAYTFNYVNDTHIIAWLEEMGFAYDVITDEDIHSEGLSLLGRYDVIITLSHPEYVSTAMWDAFDAYQSCGGRHMCLGANGFYWRIAYHSALPGVIENRRGFTGVRTWEGEPGEETLSFTGEPGGLWRCHGRAPQKLVGVGFAATLFSRSAWYRRTHDSHDSRIAFIFEGVGKDVRIGDFGRRGGGAVGLEVDRADPVLGTPRHAMVVATSEGIDYGGLLSMEEFITTTRAIDGAQNGRVRADMVFFETPDGGAVWSTGSIAWSTSLSHAGYDNPVSRITANVLRRFLDRRAFGAEDDR